MLFGQLHGSQETKGQLNGEDVRGSNEVGGGRAGDLCAAAEFPGPGLGFAVWSSQPSCCRLDLQWWGWLRNLEGGHGDFTTGSEAALKPSEVGVVAGGGESFLMKQSNLDANALGHWGLPIRNLGHTLFLLLKKELWWQDIVQNNSRWYQVSSVCYGGHSFCELPLEILWLKGRAFFPGVPQELLGSQEVVSRLYESHFSERLKTHSCPDEGVRFLSVFLCFCHRGPRVLTWNTTNVLPDFYRIRCLAGLKSRCGQGCIPLGGAGENRFLDLF